MLAKQAWRIFKSPESLLSITLKARYFPNTLILKDAPGHSPFSRQSILWGQNLMKHGLIWKVGDGKSIQTIEDHWLLDFRFKFYSSSPPLEPNLSFFVSHLVPGRDPTKLRQFFDDHVVDRILHMPILSNSYAALNNVSKRHGLGVVARDGGDNIKAGVVIPIDGVISLNIAEAKAILVAIFWI
uniref:Uncharacterized protein n=1 Tax=Cannabis sativa TaxID=3483 RepID=A0A803QE11_CANSA